MEENVTDKKRKTKSPFSPELLDRLIAQAGGPSNIAGPDGLLKHLTAAVMSRALDGELDHHLGYKRGESPPVSQPNRRNGTSPKTVRTAEGELEIQVPRDREGSFEPQLLPKHQRHFDGFNDKIVSMYARGMSVRDIRNHLEEMYGVRPRQ